MDPIFILAAVVIGLFAGVFLVVACWPLFYRESPRWWALGIAAAFAFVAIWKPALLERPNRLWIRLGLLLGKLVSPIALGILFYGVIAPIGVVVRLTGKDPLRLKSDPSASTYWVKREPPGPAPETMTQQF